MTIAIMVAIVVVLYVRAGIAVVRLMVALDVSDARELCADGDDVAGFVGAMVLVWPVIVILSVAVGVVIIIGWIARRGIR